MNRLNTDNIRLIDVFYVDLLYSKKHAHMLHKHDDVLEILYIADGEGRYWVSDREYAIREGDIIICNANTLHGEAPFLEHPIQTYCLALSGVQIEGLPAGCLTDKEDRPVLSLEKFAPTLAHIMPVIYEMYLDSPDNIKICRHFAIGVLMLVRQAFLEHKKLGESKMLSERKKENLVHRITEYLNHHYTKPLTLKKISEELHISETYLSHLFKRETGLSPIQYIIHRRIGEAQSMLMETDLAISEIEDRLGFGSSCHLSIMFKKYVGISPREYRRHFLKEK